LVTGYSNIAVNNIMAGLIKHGVKAVRCGNGHGMSENTVQSMAQLMPGYMEVRNMRAKGQFKEARQAEYALYEEVSVVTFGHFGFNGNAVRGSLVLL
jgi:hypothetical protein